ncbi:MAG TPA: cold shock domain-containing protein [Chitinispirillaceae bacterium]|nr:cold shock domain-containing protein [Chitinispirillaceae bacterium]
MSSGKVSFFNEINGTGFIVNNEVPGVIKFTYKDINRQGYRMVHEGQQVFFDLYLSPRGPRALNIIPVETEFGR